MSTVVAHLVLWLGVLLVAATSGPLLEFLFRSGLADSSTRVPRLLLATYEALPVVVALVLAARSTALRAVALVGALVVLGGSIGLTQLDHDAPSWPVATAVSVLGLATWITARRHARAGYLLLVPGVAVVVIWYASFGPGPDLQLFPYRHGVTSGTLLSLWAHLPLFALAVLGLLSSLLRPRPSPASDSVGWWAVGPLAVVVAMSLAIVPALPSNSSASGGPASDADYTSTTADPAATAAGYLDAAVAGQASVAGCRGAVPTPAVASYTIGQVSPSTSGGFDVTATVTAPDGSVQVITVHIGTAAGGQGQACIADASSPDYSGSSPAPADQQASNGFPVPSVPSATDPVPSGTSVPTGTVAGAVIPYTDAGRTPTTANELVAYQPDDLTGDQTAAVQSLIRFLTGINQQDFQAAWNASTYSTKAAAYSTGFASGYATSRHFEVSFGRPQQLSATLIAVPATFVSRQDPAAQGNPAGVTGCTFWPQYVFLAANVGGTWLDDTAGLFTDDPSVVALKRPDSSRPGKSALNPLSQRVAC